MFKPQEMTRTLIIGAKQDLEKTIELLHTLEVVHIIDFKPSDADEPLHLGVPTKKASGVSQSLVKIRSSVQMLALEREKQTISEKISEEQIQRDVALKIQDMELSVLSLTETKTRIEEHFRKIDERIRQLQPFVAMDIPLEDYQGYDHVTVFTGYVRDLKKLTDHLPKITDDYEFFTSEADDQMIALFIIKKYAEDAGKLLNECGFTEVKLPEGTGIPKQFIEKWVAQKQELSMKLLQTTKDMLEFRKRYAEFILASEEYLTIQVQKAEAPVLFGTTEHSFLIDCWIPKHEKNHVLETLEKDMQGALYIQEIEPKHDDEPPTLLKNPRPVRRFEYLLELYSLPNYRDIDPSFILSLIFPLFFGLMIGDIGYGILLILFGVLFMKLFKDSEGFSNIGWYIIIAGVFSSIFGLFLFGDMFGLPFLPPPGGTGEAAYSWSTLLGVHIPIPSVIHKMESLGMTQLLVISIIVGYLHLGLGLLLGIIVERKHNWKHAVTKIGLLFVLTALALLIFVMADWTIGQWLKPLKGSAVAPFLWGAFIPLVKSGFSFGGLIVPYVTMVLAILGIVIIGIVAGGFGLVEVLEVTSHLMSYTRLAAICVAKAAMAFAFNMIGLGLILSGNIIIGILGVILLIFMQLMVFALGALSSGIQAVRLHYVEFFMKFYKGEGLRFNPFGYKRKYTTTE
ncbi:MAG: V-type ATP synthase subunit I [Euryarchaeota archaeon]|jgi:V/A-type H+-transporting ATPase subunit I|nr:V-type ATP synthase subunit I [Euryarchaeota archaeon]